MTGRYDLVFTNSKEKLLFLLVNEITGNTRVEFTKESILERLKRRFDGFENSIDDLLDGLVKEEVLNLSENTYILTQLGKKQVRAVLDKYLDASYSDILVTMDNSCCCSLRTIFRTIKYFRPRTNGKSAFISSAKC